jgi:glycogen debranching enzyme
MNRKKTIILILFLIITPFINAAIKVGILINGQVATQEQTALKKLISTFDNVSCKLISINNLTNLSEYDIIWYQQTDSASISSKEIKAGKALKKYVSQGGKLCLSMDAVRLLNTWKIEKTQIQDTIINAVDEGFGRKFGFHAFRVHPLFNKLYGGAYTWHGKEDNKCRVYGFLSGKYPSALNSKVIAILWEYIYYHPDDKIVWETSFGKGKILAIGGFLYYNQPNFQNKILLQFTHNCIDYLENPSGEMNFWNRPQTNIVEDKGMFNSEKISFTSPQVWNNLREDNNVLSWRPGNSYVDLPNHRGFVFSKEKYGIDEIWTHPFMSLRDYRIWLDIAGQDTLISLADFNVSIEQHPNAIIRTYKRDDLQLREIITSDIDRPITIVHYEWKGEGLRRIITDFKSNLRLMWPYDDNVLGPLYYSWSKELNAFIVRDAHKEFYSLVGADIIGLPLLAGQFDNFLYKNNKDLPKGKVTTNLQVGSSIAYNVCNNNALNIYMVAGNQGPKQVIFDYTAALQSPENIYNASADYYKNYLLHHLNIVSPDTLFNEGFRWSTISSSQFIGNTPSIGTSLLAGYSSSRRGWGGGQKVSGRPGYAWYFGRDAVWSSLAFLDIGDFQTTRLVLETLMRFQRIDGKIYHELTTSGSVHFDASDATPLFVILMARYLRASGDIDFIKSHKESVYKAMEFCSSTDTNGDHLIEITNVGHGWLEGGDLYGSDTEFYLIGLWNTALDDASYIAHQMGDVDLENSYLEEAKVVNLILNKDFWNSKGYYNYGKKKDGTFTDECIVLSSVPVYLGVTEEERSLKMMKLFSSGKYSADWGVRMIDDTHSVYNPSAYHFGSVWPLFTGWVALGDYQVERYNQGFSHMMSNLLNYRNFAGRVPEVINGLIYKSSGITLHQCWSETMVLQPIIEGMLGFSANALNHSAIIAPRIPPDWNTLQVKNLRVGDNLLDLNMKKDAEKVTYILSGNGKIDVSFRPSFTAGTKIKDVFVNGILCPYKLSESKEYVTISMSLDSGRNYRIEISIIEGNSALPAFAVPQIGEESKNIHVLDQRRNPDNTLEIDIEGHPGKQSNLDLYLPQGYKLIEGANLIKSKGNHVYEVMVNFPKSSDKYVKTILKVHPLK